MRKKQVLFRRIRLMGNSMLFFACRHQLDDVNNGKRLAEALLRQFQTVALTLFIL